LGAVIVIATATLLLSLLFPPPERSPRSAKPPIERLRCPVCSQNLDRVVLRGVSVQACPHSHGMWLSQQKPLPIIELARDHFAQREGVSVPR
jgi:hypothetical protein